jgi:hypothetical protein
MELLGAFLEGTRVSCSSAWKGWVNHTLCHRPSRSVPLHRRLLCPFSMPRCPRLYLFLLPNSIINLFIEPIIFLIRFLLSDILRRFTQVLPPPYIRRTKRTYTHTRLTSQRLRYRSASKGSSERSWGTRRRGDAPWYELRSPPHFCNLRVRLSRTSISQITRCCSRDMSCHRKQFMLTSPFALSVADDESLESV